MTLLARENKEEMKLGSVCVAAIAVDELPLKMWPELLGLLCSAAENENLFFRMAALKTLGYITEDLDTKDITLEEMNSILYAVLSNISVN